MAMIPAVGIKYGYIDEDGPIFYFKDRADADAFIKTAKIFAEYPNKMRWVYLDYKTQLEEKLVFDNPYYAVFLNLTWISSPGITYDSYLRSYLRTSTPKVYHNFMELCNAVVNAKDPKCDTLYSIEDGRAMEKIASCTDADLRHIVADNLLTYILTMESEANYGKYRNLLKQYDAIDKYYC